MKKFNLEILKNIIISEVFVTKNKEEILTTEGDNLDWYFDFRRVLLKADVLDTYASLFLEEYKDMYPFQVGGLEVAAIPLISAIVMKSKQIGKPVNGFFIRKSRKKSGLLKMIEGKIGKEKIILVDDIINSGGTFIRQVEVLEGLLQEKKIEACVVGVSSILRFKGVDRYTYFYEKGIKVNSFFTLSDFVKYLSEFLIENKKEVIPQTNFSIMWSWKAKISNLWYVMPKSTPVFYNGKIYFGTDSGVFYCFNSEDGKIIFDYRIVSLNKKKNTFSTPIIAKENVIFGSHDGNMYALDTITGKRKWVFMEGDYIDSNLLYVSRHNLVIGSITLGLFRKKIALIALSQTTGKKVWEYFFEKSTKLFITYSEKNDKVITLTNDGIVCAFDAKNGEIIWQKETGYICSSTPCLDEKRKCVVFIGGKQDNGQEDTSEVVMMNLKEGCIVRVCKGINFSTFGTPVIYKDSIIVSSLDKHVRAFSLDEGGILWDIYLGSRIFSSPTVCFFNSLQRSLLYIGTNNGHFFELDPEKGIVTGKTIVSERITDGITFDEKTETVFLPTYANELYALRRKKTSS